MIGLKNSPDSVVNPISNKIEYLKPDKFPNVYQSYKQFSPAKQKRYKKMEMSIL